MRGLFTHGREKDGPLPQAPVFVPGIIGTPLSGRVQPTDSGDHNSAQGLERDPEANHPVSTTPTVNVGRRSWFLDFIFSVGLIALSCCMIVKVHCTPADQVEELQERCYKYSQKALVFEICTFIAACLAAGVITSSPTGSRTTLIVAAAGIFIAILIDLFSWKKKPQWGRGLVYMSASLLMLTTFLMFISFDRRYGYGTLSVPVLVSIVVLFQHKQFAAPPVRDDEGILPEVLDRIFDIWVHLLSLGGFITMVFTYYMQDKYTSFTVTGILFMLTIVLGLYQMMVTTARPVPLTRFTTYLDYPVLLLFVSTLISFFVGIVIKL